MKTIRTLFFVLVLATAMPLSAADVVKGIVVDPQGEPLIGVTVQEKGTQNKTITNVEGR